VSATTPPPHRCRGEPMTVTVLGQAANEKNMAGWMAVYQPRQHPSDARPARTSVLPLPSRGVRVGAIAHRFGEPRHAPNTRPDSNPRDRRRGDMPFSCSFEPTYGTTPLSRSGPRSGCRRWFTSSPRHRPATSRFFASESCRCSGKPASPRGDRWVRAPADRAAHSRRAIARR
jgi:hypothetical protein